ncbi:hypothetical protein J6590_083412 [Homalodisca vitripennis]|nr:hypothetical protein J6590_083412 [Homalodisca vitripennis]
MINNPQLLDIINSTLSITQLSKDNSQQGGQTAGGVIRNLMEVPLSIAATSPSSAIQTEQLIDKHWRGRERRSPTEIKQGTTQTTQSIQCKPNNTAVQYTLKRLPQRVTFRSYSIN